jgi:hypothetical protein
VKLEEFWAFLRFPRGKGRGTNGLPSTPTPKTSDLPEVDLYLTSKTSEVYLCDHYSDLQRSALGGFELKCDIIFSKPFR